MNWKLKLIKIAQKLDNLKIYQYASEIDRLLKGDIISQCA